MRATGRRPRPGLVWALGPGASLILAGACVQPEVIVLPSIAGERASVAFAIDGEQVTAFAAEPGSDPFLWTKTGSDLIELRAYSCGLARLGLEPGRIALDDSQEAPPAAAVWSLSESTWARVERPSPRPWIADRPTNCAALQIDGAGVRPDSDLCSPDFAAALGPDHWLLARNCAAEPGHRLELQRRDAAPELPPVATVTTAAQWQSAASDGVDTWLSAAAPATATTTPNFARASLVAGRLTIEPRAASPAELRRCLSSIDCGGLCLGLDDMVLVASREGPEPEVYLITECGLARYTPRSDVWTLLYHWLPDRDLPGAGLARVGPSEIFATGLDSHVLHFVGGEQRREALDGIAWPTAAAVGTRGEVYVGDNLGQLWLWDGSVFQQVADFGPTPMGGMAPIEDGVLIASRQYSLFQYRAGDACLAPPYSALLPSFGIVHQPAVLDGQVVVLLQTHSNNDPSFVRLGSIAPLERCSGGP